MKKTDDPFVSIAMATYNGEQFIRQQLDSVLAQTYKNFELVITDDGSTDDTPAILNEYIKKDSRVTWRKNSQKRGFINNFVEAISLCKGDVIFLCDQDDVWYPQKLTKHMLCYRDKSAVWVYNEVRLVNDMNIFQGYMTDTLHDYYSEKRRWLLNYVWGSCILGCATSYRASFIREILPPDKHAPAHDSWIQMALWPAKPIVIHEVLQDYRIHNANTSNFKLSRSPEESKSLELQAIQDNMMQLKSYSKNKQLMPWKRALFLAVYIVKKIRSWLNRKT